jgi:hypothetical protein
VKLLDER